MVPGFQKTRKLIKNTLENLKSRSPATRYWLYSVRKEPILSSWRRVFQVFECVFDQFSGFLETWYHLARLRLAGWVTLLKQKPPNSVSKSFMT